MRFFLPLILGAAIFSSPTHAKNLRVGVIGADLKVSPGQGQSHAEIGHYPDLKSALGAGVKVLAISPALSLEASHLASLPVPTFLADNASHRRIKNPNLIFAQDVGKETELALKVCAPGLFKSAVHVRACLMPHREKLVPPSPSFRES